MTDTKRDIVEQNVGEGFDPVEWATRNASVLFSKVRNAGYENEHRVDLGSVSVVEAKTHAYRHQACADEIERLREAIVSAHAQATFCLDVTGDCDEVLAEICDVLVPVLPTVQKPETAPSARGWEETHAELNKCKLVLRESLIVFEALFYQSGLEATTVSHMKVLVRDIERLLGEVPHE